MIGSPALMLPTLPHLFFLLLGHNVTQVRILGIKSFRLRVGEPGIESQFTLSQPIGHGTGACPGTAQARTPSFLLSGQGLHVAVLWRLGRSMPHRTSNHPWRGPDRRDCREEGRCVGQDGPGSATPYTSSASREPASPPLIHIKSLRVPATLHHAQAGTAIPDGVV